MLVASRMCGNILLNSSKLAVALPTTSGMNSLHTSSTVGAAAGGGRKTDREMPPKTAAKSRPLVKDYQGLCAWKDSSEVVDTLFSNIVYHEPDTDKSGLVVINKPYGLALNPAKDSPYSLATSLTGLAQKLEVEQLEVVKCVERFSSGITVLGTSSATQAAYKKSMGRLVTTRTLSTSYLAIVKGQPNLNTVESLERILTNCPDVNKPLFGSMHKEPVLSRELKHNKVGRMDTKRVHVAINSLARSAMGAGVVELSPSSTGKHFIPVYLADVGHPLLGDQMYDYRARTMMGQKVKLSTAHTNANRTQVLPTHLLEVLGLGKGEEWLMPKMLHLHRLLLPDWLGAGKSLTVFAPPPEHWVKTCKVMGINLDYKVVAEGDTVKQWKARVKGNKKDNMKTEQKETDLSRQVLELS